MFTPDEYRELILDAARNRQNWGLLSPADIDHAEHNPVCGDHLHLTLQVRDGQITAVGWDGDGCAISQASASFLGEKIKGMRLDDALKLTREDVLAMIGIPLLPTRQKCALLSLKTLIIGVAGHEIWEKTEG